MCLIFEDNYFKSGHIKVTIALVVLEKNLTTRNGTTCTVWSCFLKSECRFNLMKKISCFAPVGRLSENPEPLESYYDNIDFYINAANKNNIKLYWI